ncbi:amidase family protein [Streptomyces sp. NPDC006527]|uniref:amidase family protein n=1 Tax=Streptomyces sp. NPDC006527 TaxID=3364749 RepID=UPI0036A18D7C
MREGRLRAVDVVAGALERIRQVDPQVCAFAEVWEEAAVASARAVDGRVAAGEWLPLAGVPIGVKGRNGLRAAGALIDAGCVAVGATAVPGPGTPWQTWGLGAHGRTVNPWRSDRTPGGSSAGAAAAVAAGLVPLATGSDGAGSVRIPAAWCGIVGLKATRGRFPSADRTGLAAPGILARYAADAQAYWRVVTGAADADAPSRGRVATGGADGFGVPGRPIAVFSPGLGYADPDPEPLALARAAAARLGDAGVVRLLRPEVPLRLEDPAPAWLALRARRTGGAVAPADVDPSDVEAAATVQGVNDRRLADFFARADLLLTPTTPHPPHGHAGPGERYSTALTWAFNLSGHPAISIPAGVGTDGCPAGLQAVAAHGREALLLAVAAAAEEETGVLLPPARPAEHC